MDGVTVLKTLSRLPLYGAALLVVLLVRLLRPVKLIRFGHIRNHTIGTTALHVATYVTDRQLNDLQPARSWDLFFHTEPHANRAFDRMIEGTLRIHPFARYCNAVNARLPGGAAHFAEIGSSEKDRLRDHHAAYALPPVYRLNPADERAAEARLRDVTGMEPGEPFVCICARTSSYLQSLHAKGSVRKNADIPSTNARDSSIENYLEAARLLAERGYRVFRMGAVVDERVSIDHPLFFDYANTFRTEALDIYLASRCQFFLSDTNGLHCVPFIFRRPVANANFFNFHVVNTWGGIFIPKLFWHGREKRYLTIPEAVADGVAGLSSNPAEWDAYSARTGVLALENTPEEIADLSLEMDDRLAGRWRDTAEDEMLQQAFWSPFKDNGFAFDFGGPLKARVATTFLRRHRALL